MMGLLKYYLFFLFFIVALFPTRIIFAADHPGKDSKSTKTAGAIQKPIFLPMADPGKKVPLGNGYYLIYGFDKRPKLGTVIMKVEIFDVAGKKNISHQVKADAGMPSMSGAHETGDRAFTLSKKGDYLLPINIVMPGDWEVRITVIKDGNPIFLGRYNFDV